MKTKTFLLPIWWHNTGLFPLGNKYLGVFGLNALKYNFKCCFTLPRLYWQTIMQMIHVKTTTLAKTEGTMVDISLAECVWSGSFPSMSICKVKSDKYVNCIIQTYIDLFHLFSNFSSYIYVLYKSNMTRVKFIKTWNKINGIHRGNEIFIQFRSYIRSIGSEFWS